MSIRCSSAVYEAAKILKNDGCAAYLKIIAALLQPIIFLILFPFFADWKKKKNERTGDSEDGVPMLVQPSAPEKPKEDTEPANEE